MKKIALYDAPPALPIMTEPARSLTPTCERCVLGTPTNQDNRGALVVAPGGKTPPIIQNVCMGAVGQPNGVLLLADSPGAEDDRRGESFSGAVGRYLNEVMRRVWVDPNTNETKPYALDYVIRCYPKPHGSEQSKLKILPAMYNACRGYLVDSLKQVRPTRILTLGPQATQMVTGRAIQPLAQRHSYSFYVSPRGRVIPVFYLIHPGEVLSNRFIKREFEEDLEWALWNDPVVPPQWKYSANLIETVEDTRVALEDLYSREWVAWDTETFGRPYTKLFRILALAAAGCGSDETWVWTEAALKNPEVLRLVCAWLQDPSRKKIGQNIKYDMLAVRAAWNTVTRGVVGDTYLWQKILDPTSLGGLDVLAEKVGMGGYKEEVKDLINAAAAATKKAVKKGQLDQAALFAGAAVKTWGPQAQAEIDNGAEKESFAYALLDEPILTRYVARDARSTALVGKVLQEQLGQSSVKRVWYDLMCDAPRVFTQIEAWGVLVDIPAAKRFSEYLEIKKKDVLIKLSPYNVDVDSSKKLAQFLFGKGDGELGLKPGGMTDGGAYSTDADTLEELIEAHPVIRDILEYKRITKMLSTYADKLWKLYAGEDSRVHPSFDIAGTSTGRISCRAPNLQNIPRAKGSIEGKMARDCFVAPPGWVLLEFDYSQLELRIASMIANDPVMIQVFLDGVDFHYNTARLLVGDDRWNKMTEDEKDNERSKSKAITFGLFYGKSDASLAADLGIAKKEATSIRQQVLGKFKKFNEWFQDKLKFAQMHGYTQTWWNDADFRWRPLWEIGDAKGPDKGTAERSSYNTPIQGTGSDFCMASVIACTKYIIENAVPAKLVLTIHDSLLFEVREDAVEEVATFVQEIMTGWFSRGVPIVADCKKGYAFGSTKNYKLPPKTL